VSDMRPVVSQRYLILQNLDHPLQHASFAAGWNAVVFFFEIGEYVLQASPLPQRPLDEVFHVDHHYGAGMGSACVLGWGA
jgi:hypothetical protein